jgi:putative endopeptidase
MKFRHQNFSSSRAMVCALLVLSLTVLFVRLGAAVPADVPAKPVHGIAVDHIDRSVQPGDDFYHYANGAWIKKTVIPPDRAAVGVFTALSDLTNKRTAALIEEAANAKAPAGSSTAKIADLYNSYMDEAGIEAKGLKPLKPHLDAIAAIKDKHELAHALGETLRADVDALNNTHFHTPNLFGLWVAPGFNDSEHYAAYLLQGGIELPDREYYLSDAASMRDARTKYVAHVAAMLKLAGFTDIDARAKRIFDLEHAMG